MDEKQEIELYKKLGEDLEEKMNLIEQIFTHSVLPGDRWETAKNALNDLKRSNNLHEAVMYFYDAYGHSLHQIIPNSRQGDAEEKFEKIMRKPASDIGLYGKVKTPFEEVKKAYENGMKFIKKILLKFADNEKLLKCSKEDAKKRIEKEFKVKLDIPVKITGKKAQILGMPETPPKEEKKESEEEISEQQTRVEERRVEETEKEKKKNLEKKLENLSNSFISLVNEGIADEDDAPEFNKHIEDAEKYLEEGELESAKKELENAEKIIKKVERRKEEREEWLKKSMKKEWLTKEREEWENKIKSCADVKSLAQIEKELEEKMQKEGGLPRNDYWIYHGTPTYPGLKKLIEKRKEFLKKLAEEEAGKMYERMYKEKDKPTKAVKDWMKGAKWWKRKERIEKTEKRFGNIIWKAEKAFGMGEIEEEGKRIQKGKLRFALGFVGFVVSIILYLATEAWLLVLPVGITSVYLLITARGSAIDFFEDHPLFIVSLILSTIGFILASWPGLLAGPIFFGLSKAIPKEEIRSAVGKIMLYILLVVAFILFLPKVLEYTHITMSLPLIAIAGVINGIILGYVWTAAEAGSREELEKKLIIEQLKKIKMEEREMKEKSEDRKKREEEEKGEEE